MSAKPSKEVQYNQRNNPSATMTKPNRAAPPQRCRFGANEVKVIYALPRQRSPQEEASASEDTPPSAADPPSSTTTDTLQQEPQNLATQIMTSGTVKQIESPDLARITTLSSAEPATRDTAHEPRGSCPVPRLALRSESEQKTPYSDATPRCVSTNNCFCPLFVDLNGKSQDQATPALDDAKPSEQLSSTEQEKNDNWPSYLDDKQHITTTANVAEVDHLEASPKLPLQQANPIPAEKKEQQHVCVIDATATENNNTESPHYYEVDLDDPELCLPVTSYSGSESDESETDSDTESEDTDDDDGEEFTDEDEITLPPSLTLGDTIILRDLPNEERASSLSDTKAVTLLEERSHHLAPEAQAYLRKLLDRFDIVAYT